MNPCGTTPRAMRLRSGRLNHSLANLPSPDDLGSGIVMGWLRGERTVNAPPTPKRLETKEENGAPGEIRTPNPQIRSLMLYPVELRAQSGPDRWPGWRTGNILNEGWRRKQKTLTNLRTVGTLLAGAKAACGIWAV